MDMKLNNMLFKLNSEDDMHTFLHSYYILAFHADDVRDIIIMHYHNTIKYVIIMLYHVACINESYVLLELNHKYVKQFPQ